MNEEDKLLLFMPVVIASLTNAVYSCQLKNPELNPEQAIADVLLTWERVSSLLYGKTGKSGSRDLQIGQMLISELEQIQSRLSNLSKQPSRPGLPEEKQFLDRQIRFFVELSSFLKNS